MSTQLSPEQFASLRRVLTDPASRAAALLPISTDRIEALLHKFEAAIREHGGSLGDERIIFRHVVGRNGGRAFSESLFKGLLTATTRIVAVGDDGTVLTAAAGESSLIQAAAESEKGACLCALCSSCCIVVFAAGKIVAEIGISLPAFKPRSDWRRSWRELRQTMDDHFLHGIQSEKMVRYWFDRKKRILLAGPDGTERLFHQSLFWWCNNFIEDALSVYGETQSMGQDKTDITIVTEVGNIVIEVKWLGENENNKRYARVRIKEGMIQVGDYLNRDGRLMQGYLVLYDGRTDAAHKAQSTYPAQLRHSKCEQPVIYFLRSETPSEFAAKSTGK